MAYVAFDVDSTVGYFEVVNALANFWSPDYINNMEQSVYSGKARISERLAKKLKKARDLFAAELFRHPKLLYTVLRSNIHAMFGPLLKLKRAGLLRAVVLYSNTSVGYSLELAKALIEKLFHSPGLILCMVDHWHPIRTADHPEPLAPLRYIEPVKQFDTLEAIFKRATGSRASVRPTSVLFVDDRRKKHALQAQEREGLTYVVPTPFFVNTTYEQKRKLFELALGALADAGVLGDPEYQVSKFCTRDIPYDYTNVFFVRNFYQLKGFVWRQMTSAAEYKGSWKNDTAKLNREFDYYLGRFVF